MPEGNKSAKGGTMRLGSRRTTIRGDSVAHRIYSGASHVEERHRHRYEVNPAYVARLEKSGLLFSGVDDKQERMEIMELDEKTHPFFFAVQYHPEFLSRPLSPSPPFKAFLTAAAHISVTQAASKKSASG